jgi:uncharacterized protein involved in exopolysaccharide biosynthesis
MSTRLVPPDPITTILETVFRHKWKIVLFPLLMISIAVLIILFYPRSYVSEARVLVQVGRESVGIDPTASTGAMISLQQTGRDDEMTSAVDVLQSREVLALVVDRLGADYVLGGGKAEGEKKAHPVVETIKGVVKDSLALVKNIDKISEREEAIIELRKALNVTVERGSTIMKWEIEADSPELAQTILKELILVFQEEHLRIHRNQNSKQFFVNQLRQLEEELASAQNKLRDAKNEIGVVSILDRRTTLESKLKEVEVAQYAAGQELSRTVATINDLLSQTETIPMRDTGDKRTMPNSGADQLNSQLYALKVKRLDLVSRLSEEHPMVQAVTRQIKEAQDVVDSEESTRQEVVDRVNPIHEALLLQLAQQQSARAGLDALLETLDQQRESVLENLHELNNAEVRIDDLTRRVAVAEKQFFRYSDDLEQARIDAEMEEQRISNISLVQPAALIEKPIKPSKTLVALGGLLLAIGGTISIIVISEKTDQRVRTPAAAEALLGVPVMATLPLDSRVGRLVG